MKRYIKVKGKWYDTLEELKGGKCYSVIDGVVYELYKDIEIGEIWKKRKIGLKVSKKQDKRSLIELLLYFYTVLFLIESQVITD